LIILHFGAVSKHHPLQRVSRRFESVVNLTRVKTLQHNTCEP
jgi:hypothetical protein